MICWLGFQTKINEGRELLERGRSLLSRLAYQSRLISIASLRLHFLTSNLFSSLYLSLWLDHD